MSHASGQVRFCDGLTLHYEYDGTVDVVIPRLYSTQAEMLRNWRSEDDAVWGMCNCGRAEPVRISTEYGGGFEWPGRACCYCMCVTGGLTPSFEDEVKEATDG